MIFDSHAHYDDEAFDVDREELFANLKKAGISKVVNVGASFDMTNASIELAKTHDFIYAAAGVHPSDTTDFEMRTCDDGTVLPPKADLKWLEACAKMDKVVAIGEIGLDYYWDTPARNIQEKWFRAQLELARSLDMPIIIHSRDAAEDTYNIMKEMGGEKLRAVIHCFSYEKEMAERFLKLGYYIGIGGVITYKNARKQKEVVSSMPLDRLLLETDCPYLTPVPHRGERNSSLHLPLVIKEIAACAGVTEKEIEDITYNNACEFYNI